MFAMLLCWIYYKQRDIGTAVCWCFCWYCCPSYKKQSRDFRTHTRTPSTNFNLLIHCVCPRSTFSDAFNSSCAFLCSLLLEIEWQTPKISSNYSLFSHRKKERERQSERQSKCVCENENRNFFAWHGFGLDSLLSVTNTHIACCPTTIYSFLE